MSNLSRVLDAVRSRELPAMLLSDVNAVQWATGFTGSFGMALLTPNGGAFITDSRYTIQAKEQISGLDVVTFGSPRTAIEVLKEEAGRRGVTSLGFEAAVVPYQTYTDWKGKLEGVDLVAVPNLITDLRIVKSPEEIDKIRAACALADACFEHVKPMIQPGVVEYDLGLAIEFYFRRQGAELAFAPAVVSGPRSAMPHGRPSERKLENGDFLTLDFGAKLDGYCSDITRTVVVGQISDEHRRIYNAVLRSQIAALEGMKPGMTGKEVDALSRNSLAADGLAEYFGHGLGHGLGRLVHDGGSLSTSSQNVLEPGQVWTVEPGVYIAGFGGVRIEDDVVVTESGIEVLTHSPKELMSLPA